MAITMVRAMALSEHLEAIDHEMSGQQFHIHHQGYRVDGESSIKQAVDLNNRKSVDYFYVKNNQCLFIEFSDLARGQEDLLGIQDSLDKIDHQFHRNKLKKLVKNETRDEMVAKFKDSKDIFSKIADYYENPPAPFLNNDAKTFYIVYAPINQDLPEADKAMITRFLGVLGAKIEACLEDEICDRVRLILLEQFAVLFEGNPG